MPKLSKTTVDKAAPDPNGRDIFLYDDTLKGFGLKVTPKGSKVYVVDYRTPEGRTRRFTIGRHGSPWTCEEARKKADEILRELRVNGTDPMEEKAAAREALTVKELADLYLAEGPAEKPNKKQSSWDTDRSNITRHIGPLLGRKVAKALTSADVARFQVDVAVGKTAADVKTGFRGRAIVEGGKGIAARSMAVLGAVMSFGVRRGLVPHNPVVGVKPYKGEKMERFLSEREVAAICEGMTILEDIAMLNSVMANAFRLLMLTGCRKSEIAALVWEAVDFDRGCLRLADSKTGAKVVPLAAPALKLLADLPRTGSPYVFPATRDGRFGTHVVNPEDCGHVVGLQGAWEVVRVWCGVEDVRIHDLRHSFASFAAADGASLFLIGKVLGHTHARTTERYAHLSDDPLKAVVERTAGRIAAAMKIDTGEGAEVVALPTGRRKRT